MENVLFSLFSAILLIISTLVMVTTSLRSINNISDSFKEMEQQASDIRSTGMDLQFIDYSDMFVQIKIVNIGQTDLKQFEQWSVLVQRSEGATAEMEYVSDAQPGIGQWAIHGTYLLNGYPEVFDPGIFNPDEVMIILINVDPVLTFGQSVRVTIATPNGVTAQCIGTYLEPAEVAG